MSTRIQQRVLLRTIKIFHELSIQHHQACSLIFFTLLTHLLQLLADLLELFELCFLEL